MSAVAGGPRVLYVCHTFPWVTQSFTVREVALLRENGLDVEVLAFHRPGDLMDAQAEALLPIAHFVPPLSSAAFIRPVLKAAAARPFAFIRLLAVGLGSSYRVKTTFAGRARGVLDVLRGAYAAGAFRGARHFHAEFADNACTAAMAAAELTGKGFSFKSHSSFNPQALDRKARCAAFIALENEFDAGFFFADVQPRSKLFLNRGGVARDTAPSTHDESGGPLRLLCIGTLQEKKGQRVLIEALRLLAGRGVPFECTIVGSGPLEEDLREAIAAGVLTGAVELVAYRPHAQILALYAQHDVFVLPCVVAANQDRDGLPNVLIEAAAAGCVVVSTPVSGIPELVQHGRSGLIVPERDAPALADAVESLAVDASLRERLRQGAFEILRERFDLERNARELARKFEEVSAARA